MDLHVGTELAVRDLAVACGRGGEHPLVDPPPQFGTGRPGKARPVAARGIGGQGELADDQEPAGHCGQVEVHLASGVAEDAQAQHLVDEPVGDGLGVVGLGADEEEQARADPARDAAFDSTRASATRWSRAINAAVLSSG